MFRGFGTVLNVATVLVGSGVGVAVGHRLPVRTRDVVTDALGLVTLLVAALNVAAVLDADFAAAVGADSTLLVVLGALLIGGIAGSALRVEARLESLGGALQRRLGRRAAGAGEDTADSMADGVGGMAAGGGGMAAGGDGHGGDGRERFIEGFVSASLLFCVGPLTILGSLSDGLGRGYDQLALKAVLDGFAAIAFAASLGWGVAASALTILVVQGSLTALAFSLGGLLPPAHVAALTATGGLLLVGVSIRLLRIRPLPVGDLLPALVVAPLLVQLVETLR